MAVTGTTRSRKITLRTSEATLDLLRKVSEIEGRSINNLVERMALIYSKTYHYGAWKENERERQADR